MPSSTASLLHFANENTMIEIEPTDSDDLLATLWIEFNSYDYINADYDWDAHDKYFGEYFETPYDVILSLLRDSPERVYSIICKIIEKLNDDVILTLVGTNIYYDFMHYTDFSYRDRFLSVSVDNRKRQHVNATAFLAITPDS